MIVATVTSHIHTHLRHSWGAGALETPANARHRHHNSDHKFRAPQPLLGIFAIPSRRVHSGSPLRIRGRKRRTDWRGPMSTIRARKRGSSACAGVLTGSPQGGDFLRSSRTQRATIASASSSIHCSSNTAISLRRLAAWLSRESSKLWSDRSDASCK